MSSHKKGPKVVICGYYGFGNCGDEAVLLAIIHSFKKLNPDIRITVLSNAPKTTSEHYDVTAVQRWNPFRALLVIMSCNVLISGGGSLLQDVTSSKSLMYYLSIIRIALFLRKRVFIYCQGIGPLIEEKNRSRVAKTLSRCSAITVRDDHSAVLLRELGITKDVEITNDPVMTFDRVSFVGEDINPILKRLGIPSYSTEDGSPKPLMIAIIRPWGDNTHLAPVADFLDSQVLHGWDVLLVPAYFEQDIDILTGIGQIMNRRHHILEECLTAQQFITLVSSADCVLSMRLHGLICAMAMEVPMLALSYDPKVEAFMKQAGLEKFCFQYDEFNREAAERALFGSNGLVGHDSSDNPEISIDSADSTDGPNNLHALNNLPQMPIQKNEEQRLKMHTQAWATAKNVVEILKLNVNNH